VLFRSLTAKEIKFFGKGNKKWARILFEDEEALAKALKLDEIKVGYHKLQMSLPVRRSMLQCEKCGKYGHRKATCTRNRARCMKCSRYHRTEDCNSSSARCINCGEEHTTKNRECRYGKEARKEERAEILEEFSNKWKLDITTKSLQTKLRGDIKHIYDTELKKLKKKICKKGQKAMSKFSDSSSSSLVLYRQCGINSKLKTIPVTVDALKKETSGNSIKGEVTLNTNKKESENRRCKRKFQEIEQHAKPKIKSKINSKIGKKKVPTSNTINIASINIRSLIPKKDDIERFLEEENIDVLCIQETWISPKKYKNIKFNGYRTIYTEPSKRPGSGLITLVKNSIEHSTLQVQDLKDGLELISLKIKSIKNLPNLIISNVYIHPEHQR
jgi:hypothetical protein